MATNCITSAVVGDSLRLTNTIDPVKCGKPPYTVTWRRQRGNNLPVTLMQIQNEYSLEQTYTYPVTAADEGTLRLWLGLVDSCDDSGGPQSTYQYCDITVSAAVTTGSLAFDSNPQGANVTLDGSLLPGVVTPVTVQNVPAGTRSYLLQKAGWADYSGTAQVFAGQLTTVPTAQLVPLNPICNWIIGKGGWVSITAYNIMELVSAYAGASNIGFTVTAAHIMGAVAYYSDNLSSGNQLTGCTFT